MKKKFLSLVLVFLMMLSVLPVISANAEGVALTGIATTVGSLSPEFNADTLYYKIELANLDVIPVISATAATGYTATVVQPSVANGYVSNITVTNGSDSKTYYVRLVPTTGERIVPVTPSEPLSTQTASGYDIAEAVDSNPDVLSDSTVADNLWYSVTPAEGNACLTVDAGKVTDITKISFYIVDSNAWANALQKLYVSNDGVNFKEAGTRTTGTAVRGDVFGMGGRYVRWTFDSPVEARYIRVEHNDKKSALAIRYVLAYARTFAEAPMLESLTVNGNTHALSPSFDPAVYDYTVEVDDLSSLPQLSATAPDGYTAVVTQMTEATSYSDNYVARIKVTNNDIAFDEKVYTVRALSTQHDAMLPIVTYQEDGCGKQDSNGSTFKGGIDLSDLATSYISYKNTPGLYTVDLGRSANISEIRYNQRVNEKLSSASTSVANNLDRFEKLEVSEDGITFTDVTNQADKSGVIGNDNIYNLSFYQISFKLKSPVVARYVRISNTYTDSSNAEAALYINGTEVFGRLIPTAKLSSLTTDTGALSPAFDKDIQYYKIVLDGLDAIPVLSATAPAGCTYQIEQPVKANNYTATITADNGNGSTKIYKVRLVPASGERIIPVTPSASLSTQTASGYDIAEAVDANPDKLESGTITDSLWLSAQPDTGYAHLTVDTGKVTDITKIVFYGEDSTAWAESITKLYVSNDGVNFKEATGTQTAGTAVRGDIYGMGGRYVRWTFDSPVEARYIRVEKKDTATALKMGYVIAYARTFAEAPMLESLTVNGNTHTLSPAFNPAVYDYTVEVDDLTSLPELSATAPAGYSVEVTQMKAADSYSDNYVARIKVTNNEIAFDEKVYTVRALSTQHNAMLPLTYQERGCDAVTNAGFYSLAGGIDLSDPSTIYLSSNGKIGGNAYTNQYAPYYTVDLGCVANINEVRFNQRANNSPSSASSKSDTNSASAGYFKKVEVSSDGINFYDVTTNVTKTSGLGSDNIYKLAYYQISFKFNEAVNARYIRVSSDENVSFWIRGTEVFGKLMGDGVSHSLDVSSGKATAVYKVQNGYENSRIILALYKIVEDGIDNTPNATLSFVGAKVSEEAADGTVTAEYEIPDGKTDEYVVKAFVVESMGSIVPIALSRGI